MPDEFKAKFHAFGDYKIEQYNLYTLQVSSKKSLLVIPNQWVYIAACCCQYYVELIKYKDKLDALGFTSDMYEACHPSKDNSVISEDQKTKEVCKEKAELYLENYDGADKEFLVNFLWNYESWGGGKNIKRSNDFTDSPVLNIASSYEDMAKDDNKKIWSYRIQAIILCLGGVACGIVGYKFIKGEMANGISKVS